MPFTIANKNFNDIITFSRASGATYFDSSGLLKTAAANEVRFDHEQTQPKGILVEEERSNFIDYSSDYTQSSWTKTNCMIGLPFITGPDGLLSARQIGATGGNSSLSYSFAGAPGFPIYYTFSFYIKSVGASYSPFTIRLLKGTSQTLVASKNIRPTFGWTRVSITGNFSSAFGWSVDGYSTIIIGGDGSFSFSDTFYMFGAQLEIGQYPTSYIQTNGTQVTRAADSMSLNVGSWLNDLEGTMFIDCIPAFNPVVPAPSTDFNTMRAFSIYSSLNTSEGSDSTCDLIFRTSAGETSGKTGFLVRSPGVTEASLTSTTTYTTAINKLISAYKENDFAFTHNGDSVLTDTSGIVPPFLDRGTIGNSWVSTHQLNGWIRRVAYYPKRLDNQTLQTLTTL